jgi:hypothetical protein
LQAVIRREPDNIAAWYQAVITARGLEMGLEVSKRRFEEVVRRAPQHRRAHVMRLQQLCRKWGGSNAAMHDFARDAMLAAPAGSPLGYLVADAHLEEWPRPVARSG